MHNLNPNEPSGPLENRWEKHLFDLALIAPQNRKKYNIIVIGTGLAGASLCATLGEAGYNVKSFCYNDSPRRAHSIAAQGGINASKNYQNDGDSTWRLFYDTIKGGDFRARESNVYRLAQLSCNIIDHRRRSGLSYLLCTWSNWPATVIGSIQCYEQRNIIGASETSIKV